MFETADARSRVAAVAICASRAPDEQLALTETTQPAILTVSVAASGSSPPRGAGPAAAAGHSLGEYSAHVAAGTLEFEDAVRAVRSRGRFMQEAVPVGEGAMAAILGFEPDQVEEVCAEAAGGEVVSRANRNGPGQVVIAGHAAAVARAVEAARRGGARKAVPLPVSAPFHCSLMEPAAERLGRSWRHAVLRSGIPVFTNVDASAVTTGAGAREALLRRSCSGAMETRCRGMIDAGVESTRSSRSARARCCPADAAGSTARLAPVQRRRPRGGGEGMPAELGRMHDERQAAGWARSRW